MLFTLEDLVTELSALFQIWYDISVAFTKSYCLFGSQCVNYIVSYLAANKVARFDNIRGRTRNAKLRCKQVFNSEEHTSFCGILNSIPKLESSNKGKQCCTIL